MPSNRQSLQGFGLISILASLAIIGLVSWLTLIAMTNYRNNHLLRAGAEEVLSTLSTARAKTLAGMANSQYGVRLQSDRLILFQGAAYPGTTVETITLDPAVTISNISLAGGGSEVIFNRLTGATSQVGSVTVQLTADATKTKLIKIVSTGSAYVQ